MTVTIYKCNHLGQEELHYTGQMLNRDADSICIRATFQLPTRDLGYMMLKHGDIFTEWFYSHRWYNVFMIEDCDDGHLKGYYCNLTRPATITADTVKSDDLALDLFIQPDGTILRLDEEEYCALSLSSAERQHVEAAVAEIRNLVKSQQAPFDALANQR